METSKCVTNNKIDNSYEPINVFASMIKYMIPSVFWENGCTLKSFVEKKFVFENYEFNFESYYFAEKSKWDEQITKNENRNNNDEIVKEKRNIIKQRVMFGYNDIFANNNINTDELLKGLASMYSIKYNSDNGKCTESTIIDNCIKQLIVQGIKQQSIDFLLIFIYYKYIVNLEYLNMGNMFLLLNFLKLHSKKYMGYSELLQVQLIEFYQKFDKNFLGTNVYYLLKESLVQYNNPIAFVFLAERESMLKMKHLKYIDNIIDTKEDTYDTNKIIECASVKIISECLKNNGQFESLVELNKKTNQSKLLQLFIDKVLNHNL